MRVLPGPASPWEFWGAGQRGVAPPPHCQEHFGPQVGLGSTGQETGPGLAGGRR